MSVEIADFQIFHGMPKFTLDSNVTSKSIPCSLPPDISPLAGGVLAFTVSKVQGAALGGGNPAFDLRLFVNGQNIESYQLKSGTLCSLVAHCPVTGSGQLKPGENTIKFSAPDGLGTATITDVVLWFQRNV